MSQDLSRYAPHKEVPYIKNGELKYRPALSWAKLEPGGTIVLDMDDVPRTADLYPPFDVINVKEQTVYQAWVVEMEKFILYPNYTIEEVGDIHIVVMRSDGVRFKLIGWLFKATLLELSNYPEGISLGELLQLIIARMAERHPERFERDIDKKIAEATGVAYDNIGQLYYECGLIVVEKPS